MLVTCMNILSKRFADAGLKDVALIENTAIAAGSVDWALCGKTYNRGIRIYKVMYEALMIILLEHLKKQTNASPFIKNVERDCFRTSRHEKWKLKSTIEVSDFNEAYHMFTDINIKMND